MGSPFPLTTERSFGVIRGNAGLHLRILVAPAHSLAGFSLGVTYALDKSTSMPLRSAP
jgi:hypothetical protein